MIGHGDGEQTAAPGQVDDLRRPIFAVAEGRMQMQIGAAEARSLRQALAEGGERLTGRHASRRGR
jgi:hypothetical protein